MDDAATQRITSQLNELVADTSALSATLKRRIKALEKQGGSGRDGQIRKQQVRLAIFEKHNLYLSVGTSDGTSQGQICGGDPKLPDCRTTVPPKVQATNGAAV